MLKGNVVGMKTYISTLDINLPFLSLPADGSVGAVLHPLAGDLRQSDGTDPDLDRGKAP